MGTQRGCVTFLGSHSLSAQGRVDPGVAWLEVSAGHVLESVVGVGAWTHTRVPSFSGLIPEESPESSFLLEGDILRPVSVSMHTHTHTHTHTHRGVKEPHGWCQRPVSPSLGIMGV